MMKFKTTAKAIREGSANPRRAGYCSIQHLLWNHSPIAYTCGIYGWNFDVYEVNGLTITTGYRGMVGTPLKGCEEYEKKARAVIEDYSLTYEQRQEAVERLLKEFTDLNGGD